MTDACIASGREGWKMGRVKGKVRSKYILTYGTVSDTLSDTRFLDFAALGMGLGIVGIT